MKIHDNVILNSKISGLIHAYKIKKQEAEKIRKQLLNVEYDKLDSENKKEILNLVMGLYYEGGKS